MKLVAAVIKAFNLDEVREALSEIGVQGMTMTEVKGFGCQKGAHQTVRGAEYKIDFLPKVKIEVAIALNMLDSVIEAIVMAGKTRKVGDSKMFVFDIEQTIRIRTGETDQAAM